MAITVAAVIAASAASAALGQGGGGGTALHPNLSGDEAERRATIPIARRPEARPRVALSTPVRAPRELERGDRLRIAGELQVTTTCVDGSARCIGRPYEYSPLIGARLVLTKDPARTKGLRLTGRRELRCNQRRPNRNHHCVFVFADIAKRVRNAGRLPCPPSDCFVNMVVDASHPAAKPNSVIVLGADRPDGTVDGDKARLDVLVQRGVAKTRTLRTRRELRGSVPIAEAGGRGRRVIYSLRLDGLRRGDVLLARARQRMGIAHLPYNVFVGTRLIVSARPGDTRPRGIGRRAAHLGGDVTELNGFNCTQGPSEYRHPCETRKSGMTLIRRTPTRDGRPAPLYLNLVAAGLEKLADADPGDRMRVLGGGFLRATRYRAE